MESEVGCDAKPPRVGDALAVDEEELGDLGELPKGGEIERDFAEREKA